MSGPAPSPRHGMGIAAVGGLVYVFSGGGLSDFFVLDPANLTWTELSGIVSGTPPPGGSGVRMVASETRLYVFGGGQRPNTKVGKRGG